jgi:hypothetical protein
LPGKVNAIEAKYAKNAIYWPQEETAKQVRQYQDHGTFWAVPSYG